MTKLRANLAVVLFVAQAGMVVATQAAFHITEFMADNESSLRDEDGDYSDWIEIHNSGAAAQSLDGWTLTDDVEVPSKWRFPIGVQVPANGYLIVFASGKDRTNGTHLHASFRLSAVGEYLGLIEPSGRAASEFATAYPEQRSDISYGRDAADSNLLQYFPSATPGARNATGGPGFSGEVRFSKPSGTFPSSETFVLSLSAVEPDAAIFYSFGTNVPGAATHRYTAPITLTNSTIVRARAIQPNLLPGPISSATYIALAPDVLHFSSDLPIMVLHNFGQGAVLASGEDQFVAVQTFEPALSIAAQSRRSSLTNAPAQAERGAFHVRGFLTAVTSTNGKASFLLEVQDELGDDKDIPLLGLPEEADWVLYAPNIWDRALIQNPLAHELLRQMGTYSSRTRFFEMFLKDDAGAAGPITSADYYGLFVLKERIKRDRNRVDIEQLEPEHTQQPQVTGGYMLSLDETNSEPRLTAGGATLNWEYPSGFEMTSAVRTRQLNYISNYFEAFEAALHGPNWSDPMLGYAAYIDVGSWINYHLHSVLVFSPDALRLSTYLNKPRNQLLKMGPGWDYDRSQGSSDGRDFNPRVWRSTRGADYFNESPWWNRLFADPDFWQGWIDRYQELREGPLSTSNIFALIDRFAAEAREAQLREQTRWGAYPRTGSTNIGGFFYDFGRFPAYENEIRFKKHWYSLRLGFMDTQFLSKPLLTCAGGPVERGFKVAVFPASTPGSTVVYTVDGRDPRLSGGEISSNAVFSSGPVLIEITNNIRLVARSYNPLHRNLTGPGNPPISSPWSGRIETAFYVAVPPLRITEIMYHPEQPPNGSPFEDEDFEFIEVKNIGTESLNVQEFALGGNVEFEFPDASLQPGEHAVVVANKAAFQSRYPWQPRVLGAYRNRLPNAGGRLVLQGSMHEPILDFIYSDEWYPITDAVGFSLVHADPAADPNTWNSMAAWRPSSLPGAFPAAEDPPPSRVPRVVVNEVWTHMDAVELLNLSAKPADISGWFLTDDFRDPKRFRIPENTIVAGGGLIAFDGSHLGFSLSASGEEIYLFSADEDTLTGYSHGFDFGAIEAGLSFGRYITSDGGEQFPAQRIPTAGATNAGPRVGPIVISEIYYHPPDIIFGTNVNDNGEDEFIELHNPNSEPVPLFDTSNPASTWTMTDAVTFSFPSGVSIPPHGIALVVGFDASDSGLAESFRSRYSIPSDVPIFGPFDGKLDNSSDRIELRRPIPRDPVFSDPAPYSLVERVTYSDGGSWPGAADGLGRSLHRVKALGYANDAANWAAQVPSPGIVLESVADPLFIRVHPSSTSVQSGSTASFSVVAESRSSVQYRWRHDNRVIPNATNSLLTLQDIQASAEGEYDVIVMNAWSSVSSRKAKLSVIEAPRIESLDRSSGFMPKLPGATLRFVAGSNRTYTVEYTDRLGSHWQPLIRLLERSTNRNETIFDITTSSNRFYRLATPAIR